MAEERLRAPFPYRGGKGRWAAEIWGYLGDVRVYAEPFFGSGAVLLASDPHDREIVCDTDGLVCNFWRAVRRDPEQVAYHADWPTIHQELTARRYWLAEWRQENVERVSLDMEFCDPKVAGIWAWCLSQWIGDGVDMLKLKQDKIPCVAAKPGGRGSQVQCLENGLSDQLPRVGDFTGGQGVSAQARMIDKVPNIGTAGNGKGVAAGVQLGDQIPKVSSKPGSSALSAQNTELGGDILRGDRLLPWCLALAKRFERVIVLNRSWESALSDTMLQHTQWGPKPPVGVFLDPPYLLDSRGIAYESDLLDSDAAAYGSYAWAVEHGNLYRVVFACKEGDFPLPEGWVQAHSRGFKGRRNATDALLGKDTLYISPACQQAKNQAQAELPLFDNLIGGMQWQ